MDLKFVLVFVFLHNFRSSDASSWGYGSENGPSTWGEHYKLCGNGTRQSPIDLPRAKAVGSRAFGFGNRITFSDNFWSENAKGEFFNNGHTVEFKVDLPNEYKFTGGPFGDEAYQFLQLHFHWGSVDTQGSEHTIRGKQFPMEMHMVCINSEYIVNDTVLDDYLTNPDGVAVLGFMFELGEMDFVPLMNITDGISGLQWNETATRSDDEPSIPLELNLASLFHGVFRRGYYTYSGSFTTPGCNEVVTWVNFKKPIKISKEQLEMYRSLTDSDGNQIVDNFRPTQNLAGRAVKKGFRVSISDMDA